MNSHTLSSADSQATLSPTLTAESAPTSIPVSEAAASILPPASLPSPDSIASPIVQIYSSPIPSPLQFDNIAGFTGMVEWIESLESPNDDIYICPLVATYPNAKTRDSYLSDELSDEEALAFKKGAVLSAARKRWKTSGTVGLVTSNMSNAVEMKDSNDWHTVAMALQGSKVWVHDPAYYVDDHKGNVPRMDQANGTSMVRKLVMDFRSVVKGKTVQWQGPPSDHPRGQQDCMARSAQWIQATIDGTLPWPPDSDARGGEWQTLYIN